MWSRLTPTRRSTPPTCLSPRWCSIREAVAARAGNCRSSGGGCGNRSATHSNIGPSGPSPADTEVVLPTRAGMTARPSPFSTTTLNLQASSQKPSGSTAATLSTVMGRACHRSRTLRPYRQPTIASVVDTDAPSDRCGYTGPKGRTAESQGFLGESALLDPCFDRRDRLSNESADAATADYSWRRNQSRTVN
jgi:hypothetical protein